jgi:hypothetical protein
MESPWESCPCGHQVHEDYRTALAMCCVHPELMRTSSMNARLAFLDSLDFAPAEREDILTRVFRAAFGKAKISPDGEFSVPCFDVSGKLFKDCLRCYAHYSWEAAYLDKTLEYYLAQPESSDILLIFVGLLCRGARECDGRRRTVFCTIINSVSAAHSSSPATASSKVEERDALGHSLHDMPEVAAARARLRRACTEAIDDLKDASFKRTFLDPCEVYARAVSDQNTLIDLEVHGGPNFLALLLASVGVRLRRMPLLSDMVIGTADPIAAGFLPAVTKLWGLPDLPADQAASAPEPTPSATRAMASSLRPGRGLPAARPGDMSRDRTKDREAFKTRVAALVKASLSDPDLTVGTHVDAALKSIDEETKRRGRIVSRFVWLGSDSRAFATACISPAPDGAPDRQYYAAYLQHFFLPFSPARVLTMLASLVTRNDELCAAAQTIFQHLRAQDHPSESSGPASTSGTATADSQASAVAKVSLEDSGIAAEGPASIPTDCDDVRGWLFDPCTYALSLPAARRLFAAIDVVTPAGAGSACAH